MKKLLCLFVAMLMVMGMMVACGGNGADTTEPAADDGKDVVVEPITVHIHVRASETGEDVYVSEAGGYEYTLENRTVLAILEDFMYIAHDETIEYDDDDKLVKVGTITADAAQLWLFSQASAPKGADEATPVDANIDTYDKIKDGDTLVIYLS